MTTIEAFIKKYPLPTYFALTFALSWGAILIVVGPGGFPITTEQLEMLAMAMLLGPSVAGVLLTGLASGRGGFASFYPGCSGGEWVLAGTRSRS